MSTNTQPSFILPAARLRNYISHYWLSRNNQDSDYSVIPDGSVDIVINLNPGYCQQSVFGTSTSFTEIPIDPGSHYLGICFKPGKSRHFIHTPASHLTNTHQSVTGQLKPGLQGIAEFIEYDDIFYKLDHLLEQHLSDACPVSTGIDRVIEMIEISSGRLSITDSAAMLHKSTRQFERIFKQTVGISAKLYSQITRFQRASELISNTRLPLASIATELGYTDQSHMSHDFRRFANRTPASFIREPVVFLQD